MALSVATIVPATRGDSLTHRNAKGDNPLLSPMCGRPVRESLGRGDRNAGAAPAHVLQARPRVDGNRRRPSRLAGPRGQRPGSPSVVFQAIHGLAAASAAPSQPAADGGPGSRRAPPARGCLRACTGTTRTTTPSSRSGRRRAGARQPLSSPTSRGAPAGATASAVTARLLGLLLGQVVQLWSLVLGILVWRRAGAVPPG